MEDTSSLNSIQSRSISQAVIDHFKEKILEMEPEVCMLSWEAGSLQYFVLQFVLGWDQNQLVGFGDMLT